MFSDAEVIFEFQTMGKSVRVTALHTPTFTEISVITPSHLSRKEMEQVALQKLKYVLEKKKHSSQEDDPVSPSSSNDEGSLLV